ncbi:M48 family metallopeptidase [Bacteroides fluxus]|uniref:M48 family metallopeptidase n=1 Tax=Bacteroides fluxus TaxID=626930 RepID=UPI002353F7AF|nr:M48 family metallopeptidase [Bacteroides fluxus]
MKRLVTLFILTTLVIAAGFAKPRQKDLSGSIAIKGELTREYKKVPAGTPVIIRRVVKTNQTTNNSGIYYAVEINGLQESVPLEEMDVVSLSTPETDREFWQQVYLKRHLYEYFHNRGYKHKLRQEIDEECTDYLNKLNEIAYQDDYITSYVQSVFAKLNATTIDPNRGESLNVRVIQSAEPDAFMLPNGSMLISTGLICTLDSEDELAAIIANELSHYVLDHQVDNIYRAERRAKRAAFWGTVFAATAEAALDIAYWDDDRNAYAISFVADIAHITALLSMPTIDRLGMKYKIGQEVTSDRLARELLTFKGYNPDGLASALEKILGYYNQHQRKEDINRYGSIENLSKRLDKIGKAETQSNRPYLRNTCDVVTFNAAMNFANKRYKEAAQLIRKNISNGFATDNDYIILVKAEMALSNSEEVNNRCLSLLDKAQEMAGENPNLDIYKQRVLLLMRMNKQAKAADTLKEYLTLLTRYQEQGVEGEEKEWTNKEIGWANQMLERVSRI